MQQCVLSEKADEKASIYIIRFLFASIVGSSRSITLICIICKIWSRTVLNHSLRRTCKPSNTRIAPRWGCPPSGWGAPGLPCSWLLPPTQHPPPPRSRCRTVAPVVSAPLATSSSHACRYSARCNDLVSHDRCMVIWIPDADHYVEGTTPSALNQHLGKPSTRLWHDPDTKLHYECYIQKDSACWLGS